MATTVDTSEFERHVEAMIQALTPRLEATGRAMARTMTERMRAHILPKGGTPGRKVTGNKVGSRSGALWEALEEGGRGNLTERVIDAGGMTITSGVDEQLVPYFKAQELGAEIRPKRAKALSVPLSQAAVDALDAAGGNIRSLDLLFIQREGRAPLLMKKLGQSLQAWFVLLKKVVIPARPFWGLGIFDFAQLDLERYAEDFGSDIADAWASS